jgi:Bacterial Ig domain/Malectin domain
MLMGPQDFMDFNWINIVAAANTPPTVSITSPANGATFTAPANITINATASDSDGAVSKVDFYQGTTLLGTDTTSPYSFAWNNVAVGNYALKAVATDNAGATATSAVVNVTVNSALITPVYQVNAGGSAVSPFVADAWFANGTPFSTANTITTNGVTAPAPMAVYQSYRYVFGTNNTFTYTFTNLVANTQHKVRLHFADFYNSAAGQRKFHVDINGTRVLTNFDIIATAGAANKATVQEFTPNSDGTGKITLVFTATNLDSACVNGIEIFR